MKVWEWVQALKAICFSLLGVCGLFAIVDICLFFNDTISFTDSSILLAVCLIVGIISFAGIVISENIEEENADWMELLKKPKNDCNRQGHK